MPPVVRERELADPFSPVTRAERKSVLVVNLVLFALVYGRLIPTKISAFGIDIQKTDSRVIIGLLTAIAYYFLIGFLLYSAADRRAWEVERADLERQQKDEAKQEQPELGLAGGHARWIRSPLVNRTRADSVYLIRRAFDYWLPAVLGALNPALCLVGAFL